MAIKFDANTVFQPIPKSELQTLIEQYGEPLEVYACGNLGDICKVYKCANGKRLVLKCNGSNGCDVPTYVDCNGDE